MKRIVTIAVVAIVAALLSAPGTGLYFERGHGQGCTGCHEMQPLYDRWHTSTHRGIGCEQCHGGALTLDASFHMNNARRAYAHVRGDLPERIGFSNAYVQSMQERCARCHRQEFAAWASGPHGATYARIFLDKDHNRKNMLMDDCLRCHGMHYERGIADLVTPVSRTGPWTLSDPRMATMPSMPCLTCHELHREGAPLTRANVQGRVPGPGQEVARPSLAFYDRRTESYVPISDLPIPAMLEGIRSVKMSGDRRQSLCYQCHAPMGARQVASGDDRTPVGVHEGISCLACHSQHGQRTRASCSTCHPKMSNCGLDVEKMDTTFASSTSRHNIHRVKCADCHPSGVPRKKNKAESKL